MTPLYIFDLDGTLALIEHRRHLVTGETKDWPAFFAACVDDLPNTPVIETLKALRKSGAEIWIWSGRSDAVLKPTLAWLAGHECMRDIDARGCESHYHVVPLPYFRMRPAADHRPDEVLKAEWLDALTPYELGRIVAIFEDRDRMVKLWRSRGIACFQVAQGDF